MLVEEVIQRVQSIYSKGVQSKDTRLTKRHIYSACVSARARIIRQMSDKNQYMSDWIYQTLPLVELIKVNSGTVETITTSDKLLRSKYKIPKLVADINSEIMDSIVTMDGSLAVGKTSFEGRKYDKGNKYTAKAPRAYIASNYLYLTSLQQLEGIPIAGIFEDPIEVYQFPTFGEDCPECACKSAAEIEFPLDGNLLSIFLTLAREELILIFSQMREDKTNNAQDDNNDKGSMIHQTQQQNNQP